MSSITVQGDATTFWYKYCPNSTNGHYTRGCRRQVRMKMKVIVLFALFAFAYGDYPAAIPEIVEPTDSYGPPPEIPAGIYAAPTVPADSYGAPAPVAPSAAYGAPVRAPVDSYAPPAKVAVIKAAPIAATVSTPAATPVATPEILTAAAPEPIITETVAAAPAQSASFNFLSDLTPTLSLPSTAQEAIGVPLAQGYHTSLVPPSITLPQVQYLPTVQTYSVAPVRIALQAAATPPVTIPPVSLPPVHTPIPLPPVPLPPLPVQPVSLETKTTSTPFTQFTTIPRQYYSQQYVLSAPAPLTYAPSFSNFFQASSLPTSFYTTPRITSSVSTNTHFLPEFTSFKSAPLIAVKSAPVIPRVPATSYGTPTFEAFQKKK